MSSIGEQLKQAREARKLTIKQAVVATRVRAHYLEAMEADDFSAMPSNVQARGFLRLYADYLGLDTNELINLLQAELGPSASAPAQGAEQTQALAHVGTQDEQPAPEEPLADEPEPEQEPEPVLSAELGPAPLSQRIFSEIGHSLRDRRELISLTLDEVERHTHVRKHNLEMIETGCFDDLPSPVQARGMLNAYATLLDMDAEAVLLHYADALQARRVERQQAEPKRSLRSRRRLKLPMGLRRFISPDLIFGGSMIVVMLALSVWGAARIFSDGKDAQATPTAGVSISDVLLASPDAMSTENAGEGLPTSLAEIGTTLPQVNAISGTETETSVPTAASAVQITVVVIDRTFLRVIVDGEVKQDGRAAPGAALTFDGNERIEVLTGSGSAVRIIFNQHDLGLLGTLGEVVDRIYTVNGIETPTPTASPTPTITPKPSRTPRPTLTLPPSRTPRPSITPRPTLTPTTQS